MQRHKIQAKNQGLQPQIHRNGPHSSRSTEMLPPTPHPPKNKNNNKKKKNKKKPAFARYADQIKLQSEYLQIAGRQQYSMPNFLGRKCLKKNTNRETEYDFGEESHFQSITDHPCVNVEKKNNKQKQKTTKKKKKKKKKKKTNKKKQKKNNESGILRTHLKVVLAGKYS